MLWNATGFPLGGAAKGWRFYSQECWERLVYWPLTFRLSSRTLFPTSLFRTAKEGLGRLFQKEKESTWECIKSPTLTEVVGSNPASPSSQYSGEVVLSEGVPERWRGSWVGQFASELLSGHLEQLFHPSDHFSPIFAQFITFLGSSFFFFLANFGGGGRIDGDLFKKPTP